MHVLIHVSRCKVHVITLSIYLQRDIKSFFPTGLIFNAWCKPVHQSERFQVLQLVHTPPVENPWVKHHFSCMQIS